VHVSLFLNTTIVLIKIGKTTQDTIESCYKTFIEPITALYDNFARIKVALNRREDFVSNWKAAYASLKKYQEKKEKTSDHCVKLEKQRKAEEIASKELKMCHTKLLNDMLMFLKERIDYLKPSVNAFITIQLLYYSQSTELFTKLMPVTKSLESPTNAMSEQEHDTLITDHLNRIKNLMIIKSD
jgi:hypothetical protein